MVNKFETFLIVTLLVLLLIVAVALVLQHEPATAHGLPATTVYLPVIHRQHGYQNQYRLNCGVGQGRGEGQCQAPEN